MPSTAPASRAQINRANARHSTGPRTESGKHRASLNALKHGLTAQSAILPAEDPAAYQRSIQRYLEEYRPANATETQLVHELANLAWRQNRIPILEAGLLDQDLAPQLMIQSLSTLGIHSQRLSRQFQKTLDQLRSLQSERREREQEDLKDAAGLFEYHKHKGIEWDPSVDGFVFSKQEVELHAQHLTRLSLSRDVAYRLFTAPHPHLFTWAQ